MNTPRLLVVGQGAAGLCAAVCAKEAANQAGAPLQVTLVDAESAQDSGGNTRWSPSNLRLQSDHGVEPDFVQSIVDQSGGQAEPDYFQQIADRAPAMMAWLEGMGVAFQNPPYYLAKGPSRIRPVGGGAALLQALLQRARGLGVECIYGVRVTELLYAHDKVLGITGQSANQAPRSMTADAVVLACGGFQGNPGMLAQHLGAGADSFRLISPGTGHNDGGGIRAAMAVGARTAGDWHGAHAEPVDRRSRSPAPVVLVYPYGIAVNTLGERFFDEGAGLMHQTWEQLAHDLHFRCPGGAAYAVLDASLLEIADYQRAIRSEVPPIAAPSVEALAQAIGVPPAPLLETVAGFNRACAADVGRFDPARTDGLSCRPAGQPPKSNWARSLHRPPYLAWPLAGAIAYTFGGLKTDLQARVLGDDGPIEGLYAAGEITGHFYGVAPNAVAMLRALVYGRVAGHSAAELLAHRPRPTRQ